MSTVSALGLAVGEEIKRRELHSRFGGPQQGGMSPCPRTGLILLFTTPHGDLYGYEDRFQPDGMFWYKGEGQVGDMRFVRANRALRDHEAEGKKVYLFEQTRKSFVRLVAEVRCDGFHNELRPDRDGQQRQAIVFHLEVLNATATPSQAPADPADPATTPVDQRALSRMPLDELRVRALSSSSSSTSQQQREIVVRYRAEAIRQYALRRAAGVCESCLQPAPFQSKKGPYLEVHHLHRLSDGGPDHPDAVAAICPNCHREIHAGVQGSEKNGLLVTIIRGKEAPNQLSGTPHG